MSFITLSKTAYIKLADASLTAFSAQCRSTTGMEIVFDDSLPAVATPGVIVPPGLEHGVTRANGEGHLYAKVPAAAPEDAAIVAVVG
jgi:hypothetical protein